MDVDNLSFFPLLLDMLTDISEAHFVSIDLELSGVPAKGPGGQGKASLQERYADTKAAAERYQILQVGLTCAEQRKDSSEYVLKPYNIHLSPLIAERGLDIDRDFTFSASAVDFLISVDFALDKPFHKGVPYLSREETNLVRAKFAKRQDKKQIADINLLPEESESIAFMAKIRAQIEAWQASKQPNTSAYLDIGNDQTDDDDYVPELSRYEKRLVHQLVRAEFPDLVTISRRGYIQILPFDREREEKFALQQKKDHESKVMRQKGFRWIIEALLGSNLDSLDVRECARDSVTGYPIYVDRNTLDAQFHRAKAHLRHNPAVLIGHNCFQDLVYIYRTFIGELPPTVGEFQQKLHSLWPTIIDTKYMSTHNCGDISPASSLSEIASQMKRQATPAIKTHEDHSEYDRVTAFHEAGYDSFLTAQVAIRLSKKLFDENAADLPVAITDEAASLKLTEDSLAKHDSQLDAGQTRQSSGDGTLVPESTPSTVIKGDQDIGQPPQDGFTPSIAGAHWKKKGDPTLGPQDPNDIHQYNPRKATRRFERLDSSFPGSMPQFNDIFWQTYGNKLRVFGTKEGVCVLDSANGLEFADPPVLVSDAVEDTGGGVAL